jgi:hypothetical protein
VSNAADFAQPRDNRLKQQLPPLLRGHDRRHLRVDAVPDEGAVDFPEADVGNIRGLPNEQESDVRSIGRTAVDRDEVALLFLDRIPRLTVDRVRDWAKRRVCADDEKRRQESEERKAFAGDEPDTRRAP